MDPEKIQYDFLGAKLVDTTGAVLGAKTSI